MVKTAVVSWTKYETVLNIILNILVDCFLCSLSNTDWPLPLRLKVANPYQSACWCIARPAFFHSTAAVLIRTKTYTFDFPFVSSVFTHFANETERILSLMNFDLFIGEQILVPCLIWDLESWPLFTNHLICPDWDGMDFRDNRRCKAGLKTVVDSLGWLIRWGSHSAEFSAVNLLREQLAMG